MESLRQASKSISKSISKRDDLSFSRKQQYGRIRADEGEEDGLPETLAQGTAAPNTPEPKQKRKNKKKGKYDGPPPIPYYQLYRYADVTDWVYIVAGTVGAVGAGACLPLVSVIMGDMMDAFNAGPDLVAQVNKSVLQYVYLGVFSLAMSYLQMMCWTKAATNQSNRIRELYLHAVLRQEVGWFDSENSSGGLLQGLNEDTVAIQSAIGEKVGVFINQVSVFVIGITIAFTRGWDLTLVLLSLIPLLLVAGVLVSLVTGRLQARTSAAYADANSVALQALANIRTVYASNAEDQTMARYSSLLEPPVKMGVAQSVMGGVALGSTQMVMMGGYALAMWYGSTRVAAGDYTGGQVLMVLFASLMGGMALGQAAPHVPYFVAGASSGGKVWRVLDRTPAMLLDAPGEQPDEVLGEVELRDVTFAYPSRPDVTVFSGFSLRAAPGTTVALVGESGSGKSTVIGLLERFYDPLGGQVLLDGRDIRRLQLRWYRQQIGLVQQEPTLFATSIFDNIRFGRPDASADEVYSAARASNAHGFISDLPKGYDTQVGERGVQLSGGQKQRIAIARAILKDPKILLLDEATSALDASSERLVQQALEGLMKGRTTLVVAHRLSTIMDADVVAVVSSGRIVEQGSPQQLLTKPEGAFSSLVKAQQATRKVEEAEEEQEVGEPLEGGIMLGAAAAKQKQVAFEIEPADESFVTVEFGGKSELLSLSRSSAGHSVNEQALAIANESFLLLRQAAPRLDPVLLPGHVVGAAMDEEEEEEGSDSELEVEDDRNVADPAASSLAEHASVRQWVSRRRGLAAAKKAAKAKAEEETEKPVKVGFVKLLAMNREEWPAMTLGILASIGAGCVMPIFSITFASILAVFYLPTPEQIQAEAVKWSLVFVALGGLAGLAGLVQQSAFGYMGHRLAQRVRMEMLDAVLHQEVGWFDRDENASGAVAGRLAVDTMAVRGAVGDQLGIMCQNLVVLIAGYCIAFINGWKMALVVIACLPVVVVAAVIGVRVQTSFTSKADDLFSGANQLALEAFTSIRTVAAFTMEKQVTETYHQELQGPTRASAKRAHVSGLSFGMGNFSIYGVYALGFWFGGQQVAAGEMTFEQVNKVFFAIVLAAFGFAQAQQAFPDLAKGKGAVTRVFGVIKRKPAIDARDGGEVMDSAGVKGNVELRDITFAYPSRPDVKVFKGFNLEVPAGQSVALVGESGSGKSTVVGLLERFYDPLGGQVLLDGRDIRSLDLYALRSIIGLVGQEPVLFSMSIRDNITYGLDAISVHPSDEEIEAAARAANAWAFIEKQPQGLDTQVGERGVQLSGGQKQRIAIARAVARNPRILLLDEATSALDAESERLVQQALDDLMKGRTTVVVAHRLSTIRNADSIAVVSKGAIVEQGSHSQLLAQHGAYANLVKLQQVAAES